MTQETNIWDAIPARDYGEYISSGTKRQGRTRKPIYGHEWLSSGEEELAERMRYESAMDEQQLRRRIGLSSMVTQSIVDPIGDARAAVAQANKRAGVLLSCVRRDRKEQNRGLLNAHEHPVRSAPALSRARARNRALLASSGLVRVMSTNAPTEHLGAMHVVPNGLRRVSRGDLTAIVDGLSCRQAEILVWELAERQTLGAILTRLAGINELPARDDRRAWLALEPFVADVRRARLAVRDWCKARSLVCVYEHGLVPLPERLPSAWHDPDFGFEVGRVILKPASALDLSGEPVRKLLEQAKLPYDSPAVQQTWQLLYEDVSAGSWSWFPDGGVELS